MESTLTSVQLYVECAEIGLMGDTASGVSQAAKDSDDATIMIVRTPCSIFLSVSGLRYMSCALRLGGGHTARIQCGYLRTLVHIDALL